MRRLLPLLRLLLCAAADSAQQADEKLREVEREVERKLDRAAGHIQQLFKDRPSFNDDAVNGKFHIAWNIDF